MASLSLRTTTRRGAQLCSTSSAIACASWVTLSVPPARSRSLARSNALRGNRNASLITMVNVMGDRRRYPWVVSHNAVDLFSVERPLLARGDVVVGIDEVGRGAMAGPMTVGAVVLTCDASAPERLTDSKLS